MKYSAQKPKKESKSSAEVQVDQPAATLPADKAPDSAAPSTVKIVSNSKSMLISDKLNPKKKKGSEIMNLNDALKELNIITNVSENKKRQACDCQGEPIILDHLDHIEGTVLTHA
jgi:hypothetical protein